MHAVQHHQTGHEQNDDKTRIVREIDLSVMNVLWNYVSQCAVFAHCESLLRRHAFFDKGFDIVLGDEANEYESSYLNSQSVRRKLVRFLLEARSQQRVFRLVVVRFERDLAQWTVRYARAPGHNARDELALPFSVVPLHPKTGRLFYVIDEKRAPGMGEWVYEPLPLGEDRRGDKKPPRSPFFYKVYKDENERFVQPVAAVDMHFRDAKLATYVRNADAAQTNGGIFLMHSNFWEGYARARIREELEDNVYDAEHCTTHPRIVYAKKPDTQYQPETISDLNKTLSAGMHEASSREYMQVAWQSFQAGFAHLEHMQEKQPRKGTDGEAMTKRRALRERNDRPSVNDDAVLLPEFMEVAHMATPTYQVDLVQLMASYEETMAKCFGGIPIADVQNVHTDKGVTNKAESTNALKQRDQVYHGERLAHSDFWRRVYADSLARIDLYSLDAAMEAFDENERRALGGLLLYNTAFVTGARRRESQTHMAQAMGVRRPEAATVRELREAIAKRLATADYVESTIRFNADIEYYDFTRPEMREHEHLEPEILEARHKETALMAQLKEVGVLGAEDVRKHVKELYGIKTAGPTAAELKMVYPPPKPAAPGGKK